MAPHTKKGNPARLPARPSSPPAAPGRPYVLTRNDGGHEVRIAIICDNYSPHLSTAKDSRVGDWAEAANVEIAYTPSNASWLNRIVRHEVACDEWNSSKEGRLMFMSTA